MRTYETILKLKEQGDFKVCLQKGVIAFKLNDYFRIYEYFLKQYDEGKNVCMAVRQTSIDLEVSEQTVYRARRMMES